MPIQNSKLVHALLIVPSLLQMLQLLKDIALIIRLIHEMLFIGGIFEVHRKCKMKHEIVYGMQNEKKMKASVGGSLESLDLKL